MLNNITIFGGKKNLAQHEQPEFNERKLVQAKESLLFALNQANKMQIISFEGGEGWKYNIL